MLVVVWIWVVVIFAPLFSKLPFRWFINRIIAIFLVNVNSKTIIFLVLVYINCNISCFMVKSSIFF